MSIIVTTKGRNAIRLPAMPIPREGYLEDYVALNLDVLPLDQIREGLSLLVLDRQFPTLSGPIDVLAVDDTGALYVIETKLYRNADKRRVVAQMLDYGAAIARELGSAPDPVAALAERLRGDLRALVKDEFGTEAEGGTEGEEVLQGIHECLRDGTLRFVVLMDTLDDRLRDLIRFLNQFSQFSIFAVEAQFYQHREMEIVIPTLFGSERMKPDVGARRVQGEVPFFEAIGRNLPRQWQQPCRRLFDYMASKGADPNWGRGNPGAFNPRLSALVKRAILTLDGQGRLTVNFKWMKDSPAAMAFRAALARNLQAHGFSIPDDYEQRFLSFPATLWCPKTQELIAALQDSIVAGAQATSSNPVFEESE